ncbi:MAG: hypothetical protein M3R08_11615, partial [Bacteroidota bacterium]|nr:hypothetical protein [Bacteroidota bacterium]
FISCSRESDDHAPPCAPTGSAVVFDMDAVPYDSLSTYNFFEGVLSEFDPVDGVLPYDVITPLFTDYAHKSRFIWMPQGISANYVSDDQALDFGNGTVFIKNFYYDNVEPDNTRRIIETRLMFKRNGIWEFANYVWNAEQTEAVFDLQGSYTPVSWTEPTGEQRSAVYRIPSTAECLTCHKRDLQPIPIGPKPQNINSIFTYEDGPMGQMEKWVQAGYLNSGYPSNIGTTVRWDDPYSDLQERVRSYLDMNCSHCHADQKHCDYRPIRLAWSESTDPEDLGICVEPDEIFEPWQTHIVSPGNIERSMMHFRLSATEENIRMPLLGRTLVHEEAVDLIENWIESLDQPCN